MSEIGGHPAQSGSRTTQSHTTNQEFLMRLSIFLLPLAIAGCTTTDPNDTGPGGNDLGDPGDPGSIAKALCPPPTTFQRAVCVCDDLDHVGELHITPGPGGTGGVGVNGRTNLVGTSEISGELVAWGGLASAGASIGESLITPANVSSVGDLHVGGSASIGGDLTCAGEVTVSGDLALGGALEVIGSVTTGARTAYTAPAAPPCGCDPSTFFDVEGAVDAAAQATAGHESWTQIGEAEMHLQTGNYYVTSSTVAGTRKIVVDGNASVFVDGSLASVGSDRWELSPGATLDLFVSGNVLSAGNLTAGNPDDPSAFHLYVGGDSNVAIGAVGETRLAGSIYAPRAIIAYVGDAVITGSIFARSILGAGSLSIEYGDGAGAPTSCEPSGDDGDSGGTPQFL
jgi:predicted acyltransferase (DUF342 family)